MTEPTRHSRRRVLQLATGAASGGVLGIGLPGCSAAANDRQLAFKTLADAMRELDRLSSPEALPPATAWNWSQTLNHCAQSIEFSMLGFPQPKPRVFQATVGTAAFRLFAWRGRMTHDLGEPIPGAPALDAQADVATAVGRLQQAALAFTQWKAALKPHFAYGELSHAEYEQAHAMHLANHFSAFRQRA